MRSLWYQTEKNAGAIQKKKIHNVVVVVSNPLWLRFFNKAAVHPFLVII
jgi:hypothetical protein